MPKKKVKVRVIVDGLDGAPLWITTFVDMISLLVTFFILLYTFASMREFDTFTYPRNIISTSGIFDEDGADTIDAPAEDLMLAMDLLRGSRKRHTRPVNELRENMEEMGQKLTDEHLPIDLRGVGDGLNVMFPVKAGFRPGSAIVNPALETALLELADTVQFYPLMIVVEGHTDDAFVPSPRYPDEDALGIARARSAAMVLSRGGGVDPSLVMLESGGARKPRNPQAATARERVENRRVEVRLVSMSKDRVASTSMGGER